MSRTCFKVRGELRPPSKDAYVINTHSAAASLCQKTRRNNINMPFPLDTSCNCLTEARSCGRSTGIPFITFKDSGTGQLKYAFISNRKELHRPSISVLFSADEMISLHQANLHPIAHRAKPVQCGADVSLLMSLLMPPAPEYYFCVRAEQRWDPGTDSGAERWLK